MALAEPNKTHSRPQRRALTEEGIWPRGWWAWSTSFGLSVAREGGSLDRPSLRLFELRGGQAMRPALDWHCSGRVDGISATKAHHLLEWRCRCRPRLGSLMFMIITSLSIQPTHIVE